MNSFGEDVLVPIVAIICSIGLPVIAVILAFVHKMKKYKADTSVRKSIIENKTDLETAKILINEPKKNHGLYFINTLRRGCILIGIGLGTLVDWLANVPTSSIYFWLNIVTGLGVGFLCSFIVELYFYKKEKKEQTEKETKENSQPSIESNAFNQD